MRNLLLLIIILTIMGSIGCSRFFVSREDPKDTFHLVETARTFIDDSMPLWQRAIKYEDVLFFRFVQDPPIFTMRRKLLDNSDPYGLSSPIRKGSVADSAIFGGMTLETFNYKYVTEIRENGEATTVTLKRYDDMVKVIDAICNISGVPGLIVRGLVSVREIEEVGWKGELMNVIDGTDTENNKNKWFRGKGKYSIYWYRGDPSPGQFHGIAEGLYSTAILGPEKYRDWAITNLEQIALYLKRNNFVIIDADGEKTGVHSFGIGADEPFITVPDSTGGSVEIGTAGAFNRHARILTLLEIIYLASAISNLPQIDAIYDELCSRRNLQNISLHELAASGAGFNFHGFLDAGQEQKKIRKFYAILSPITQQLVNDDQYHSFYLDGMKRVFNFTPDLPNTESTLRYYAIITDDDKRSERIENAIAFLETYPYPKRDLRIINSNRKDIDIDIFFPSASKLDNPLPISAQHSVLPLYETGRTSWYWEKDLRILDDDMEESSAGLQEYSTADFLNAYWFGRYAGMIDANR